MKTQKYKQVELTQKSYTNSLSKYYIAYIPIQFAILNEILLINGEYWTVTWCSKFDVDMLPDTQYEIRKHRKNTGDSLPK